MSFKEGERGLESHLKETQENRVDYLDEKTKVTLDFTFESGQYFPHVTEEDLKTRQERYRILLGKTEIIEQDQANVSILAVMEADPEEEQEKAMYTEGVTTVHPNIGVIKQYVENISASLEEYKDYELIGDIHTHPVTQKDLHKNQRPWHPSSEDIESIAAEYERGILSKDKPYIFGIAVRVDDRTVYAFYRLVKTPNGYKAKRVSNNKK